MTDEEESKLSDFGGGVDEEIPPEDDVRITLSRWLTEHGASVYWDKSHSYGYNTFSPGQRARPDLLIEGQFNWYAVEVKVGDDSSKIHDALPQVVNYWEAVVNGETNYTVDGKSVDIDAFLLATKHSPHGRLYPAEGESDVLRTKSSEGRQVAVQHGHLPNREFNASERVVRAIWRFAKDRNADAELGIGALLSSRLDGDESGVDQSQPMALFYRPGGIQPEGWNSPGYQFWNSIPTHSRK